jgi:hypothetical protein
MKKSGYKEGIYGNSINLELQVSESRSIGCYQSFVIRSWNWMRISFYNPVMDKKQKWISPRLDH